MMELSPELNLQSLFQIMRYSAISLLSFEASSSTKSLPLHSALQTSVSVS